MCVKDVCYTEKTESSFKTAAINRVGQAPHVDCCLLPAGGRTRKYRRLAATRAQMLKTHVSDDSKRWNFIFLCVWTWVAR